MNKGGKDETLVRQTISRLLDFHGVEIGNQEPVKLPVQQLDGSIRAPSIEHLDMSDPIVAAVADGDFSEGPLDDWGEPTVYTSKYSASRVRASRARQKKLILLIPVLSILLLVVLNKFYGVPSFDTQWFRLATYRSMVANLVDDSAPAVVGTSGPVKLKVRGIACSEELSSAVIVTTIVHEGDRVLGATVVRITKDSVEFEMNGQTWTQKVQ